MQIWLKNYWFDVLLLGLLLLFFAAQNINEHFNLPDFEMYYTATQNLLAGENIYNIAYGADKSYFKYAPFSLLLFVPLASLPFGIAKIVYFVILSMTLFGILYLTYRLFQLIFPDLQHAQVNVYITFLLTLLIAGGHLFRELHLGNTNLIVLFFLILSLFLIAKGETVRAGFLTGLVILFKPHFIVLLPLWLIRRRILLFGSGMLAVGSALILPAIFIGTKANIILTKQWVKAMIDHQHMTSSDQTLYALLNKWALSFLLEIEANNIYLVAFVLFVIALIFLSFLYKNINDEHTNGEINPQNFVIESLLLIALVPNITITNTQHFLWSIPVIILVLCYLFSTKTSNTTKIILLSCIGFTLYGFNWHDIMGHYLSHLIEESGLLGLGNILILAVAGYVLRQLQQARKKQLN